jgi:uncharacterized membrane protein YfcA
MAVLGGFLGAIVFVVVTLLIEVALGWDKQGWADFIPFAMGVAGILVGSALGRRFAARRPRPS